MLWEKKRYNVRVATKNDCDVKTRPIIGSKKSKEFTFKQDIDNLHGYRAKPWLTALKRANCTVLQTKKNSNARDNQDSIDFGQIKLDLQNCAFCPWHNLHGLARFSTITVQITNIPFKHTFFITGLVTSLG